MEPKAYLDEKLAEYYENEGEIGEEKTLFRRKDNGDRLIVQRLPAEADLAVYARLLGVQNDRVARVYDIVESPEAVFVLLEYVEGKSLAEVLDATLPEKKTVRRIARDVCDGLCQLHALGIAHKDLKPENVVLDAEGRARLIDLNIATVFDEGRRNKTAVLGTVGYAAPEQFGFSRTDARTDIYAYGVLLNLLLTRVHPTVKLYRKGRYGRVLKKCLAISPADRYENAMALKRGLSVFG